MAQCWNLYIDMMSLLLQFLRLSEEGNWPLHLVCIRDMMPWSFAYGRTNYSHYMPLYWCEMMTLPETHPQANAHLHASELQALPDIRNTNCT